MAIDQPAQRRFEMRRLDRAVDVNGDRLLIGVGAVWSHLRQHPEIALRFGQRKPRRRTGEEAAGLHLAHALAHGAADRVEIGRRVLGREEQRAAFPDVDAAFDQVMAEEIHLERLIQIREVARHVEAH